MDTREFPVLTDDDRDLIERLAVALGADAARVLAYLLRRDSTDRFRGDPATRLAVRVGTSLNRDTVSSALRDLEERDLVSVTTLRDRTRGRPPKAWRASDDVATTVHRADERHAQMLLDRAKTIGTALGTMAVEGGESTETDSIRLGLNWLPNALHAPFFCAVSTGEYDGIDVAIEHYRGSGRALDSLVSGETDVALAGAATTVRAQSAGEQVVPLALYFQRAMAVLYTTREAFGCRFDGIEALRDRRVGMSSSSETGLLGRLFLSQAGIVEDVSLVDLAGEEQAALESNRADVVTGSFADPQQLQADGRTVDSLLVADQFPMYGPALVTTERTLETRREALEQFLAGTIAGWAVATRDPESAVKSVEEGVYSGDDVTLDPKTFEHAVEKFGTSSAVEKHGWGWQRVDGWERLVTALDQVDLLSEQA